ncbi:NAD(P)H-binding protein [Nonomuraea sediminis]|uniref:NAD(P)H-binding protein n=1 Tax=Nonomuraea sediminis TaxID=2835864 RepID=UPI001BDC0D47|nr:NAD(P)H-binding protein [Nonomuraea sediminis]
MSILVIGGTGRVGSHVVRKLTEAAQSVRVLGRSASGPGAVRGSIDDPAAVRRALEGAVGVVIAVESGTTAASARAVHEQGVRNVVEAAAPGTQVVLVTQIYLTRADEHPEMGYILGARFAGEEAVRRSGLPYTIVRPSWLTGQPGGRSALLLDQGDTGDGQVSREDIAEICVQALRVPTARGKTFEVYGVPGDPVADWQAAFAKLAGDAA